MQFIYTYLRFEYLILTCIVRTRYWHLRKRSFTVFYFEALNLTVSLDAYDTGCADDESTCAWKEKKWVSTTDFLQPEVMKVSIVANETTLCSSVTLVCFFNTFVKPILMKVVIDTIEMIIYSISQSSPYSNYIIFNLHWKCSLFSSKRRYAVVRKCTTSSANRASKTSWCNTTRTLLLLNVRLPSCYPCNVFICLK